MSFIQGSYEDDDCPAENEVPRIASLFLAAYFHIGSTKYRADGSRGGCFFTAQYRLDIVPYDLEKDLPLAEEKDRLDWALVRLSCRRPFFNRPDVQFAIASLPGIEHVREHNLNVGTLRYSVWKRAADPNQLRFGFEADVDLRRRAVLYEHLRHRMHDEDFDWEDE